MPSHHVHTSGDKPTGGLSTIRSRSRLSVIATAEDSDLDIESHGDAVVPTPANLTTPPRTMAYPVVNRSFVSDTPPEAKSSGTAFGKNPVYHSKVSVAGHPEQDRRGSMAQMSQSHRSKNSVRESITSPFDTWRAHQFRLTCCMAVGSFFGIVLAVLCYAAGNLTVPNESWFNGLHIVVAVICTVIGHWADLVVVFASRAYVAFALLGEDGISLQNVEQAVSGGAFTSLRCLIGDRLRLSRLGDHAAVGRRASGLLPAASIGILIAICMPLLHIAIVLASTFDAKASQFGGFECDIADFSNSSAIQLSTLVRTVDMYLGETPTEAIVTFDADEYYIGACYDVEGHGELTAFSVSEIVESLRLNIVCDDAVPVGISHYMGATPVPAGKTNFMVQRTSGTCDDGFCIMSVQVHGYGTNGTTTNCTISSQNIAIAGLATFSRAGLAKACQVFEADPDSATAPDPYYQAMWEASLATFTQVLGRWPTGSWMGGLAYELEAGDFEGFMTPSQAEHIVLRLMGSFHRMLSSTYVPTNVRACTGTGNVGSGTIIMPVASQVLGIFFGVASLLLAGFTWSSERSIQLMVGSRNYRRSVSALDSPLRFAALLDRSKAMQTFSGMCDETPEVIAKTAGDALVLLGGDADVSGNVGHACISSVDEVDLF
ncbi:hypothetical protein HKX48_002042, partial [Thoreauomyces humboldtii]